MAAAFVPSVLAAQSESTARAGVEQTNRGFMSAFKAGDAANITTLYAPNPVVVEPDGARYEGKRELGALLKQFTSSVDFTAFEIMIESFGSGGNIAWAGGNEIATVVDKKTKKSNTGTVTYLAVYDRQATVSDCCGTFRKRRRLSPAPNRSRVAAAVDAS